MVLPIVKIPDKVLTSKTRTVKNINEKFRKLVADMEETLKVQKDPEGVGLAAPQVGVDLSFFIIKPKKTKPASVFINPVIKEVATETQKIAEKKDKSSLEGCLSIDKIWSPVRRPQKILLSYQTLEGETKEEWFSGFDAVIIQHEVDHLEGILFTQRALEQNRTLFKEIDGELKPMETL
jgi:peptide deformylase